MGLNEQEQKVLEELERQLTGGKPKAKSGSESGGRVRYGRLLVLGSLMVVVGLSLLVFATTLQTVILGVAAFLTMLIGLYLVSQNWSGKAYRAKQAPQKPKPSSGSFFQDRWDQRNRN